MLDIVRYLLRLETVTLPQDLCHDARVELSEYGKVFDKRLLLNFRPIAKLQCSQRHKR